MDIGNHGSILFPFVVMMNHAVGLLGNLGKANDSPGAKSL
jgi:hypothetical protein